ncbi:hypothetical protein SAMN04515665_109138 [Blastococcus sp. DSM 46786]|uniref:hypothetical protein n=1 Tax=Blastococcus sp. DSM 46786 TaxID=1798227 RepID=UPI0008C23295|nr:hypothetical protein [Blastococcus sp. DSM 46786]SEL20628.1 hypothetical protein SAMN04515665_109138 [Blastococcus sp. DSM 46786]
MTTGTSRPTPPWWSRRRSAVAAGAVTLMAALLLAVALWAGAGAGAPANSPAAVATATSTGAQETGSDTGPADDAPAPSAPADGQAAPTGDPAELPPSLAAVGLDATARIGDGMTGALLSLQAVEATATGPGNVAGPALRVTVRLVNGTAAPAPLDGAVVTMAYGAEQTPASPIDDPSAAPFAGVLEPGGAAEGVYVFGVPEDTRETVTVSVGYRPGAPYLVFSGAAA